jgi:hypothetical protein
MNRTFEEDVQGLVLPQLCVVVEKDSLAKCKLAILF